MPFDLSLLFPLIGGYFLVTYSNYWKHEMARKSGHRLLFHAAFAGIILTIIARLVVLALLVFFPEIGDIWKKFVPFSYSGTAVGALLIGLALVPISNYFFPNARAVHRLITKQDADALERLMYVASEEQKLIQLTLDNEKVYVGLISWTPPNPNAKDAYICIAPMLSGYRNPTDKTLNFTTSYTRIYAEDESGDSQSVDLSTFMKVIPIAKIYTASLFDSDIYEKFNKINSVPNRSR